MSPSSAHCSTASSGQTRPTTERRVRHQARRDESALSEARLLYVEDDPVAREQLAEYLRRRVKELYVASDGLEGLDLFAARSVDLVVTDILMPRMDGLRMAHEIKAKAPSTPIVVTSAFSEAGYLMQAIELGIDRYVLKPVDTGKLLDALEFCARAARASYGHQLAQAVVDSVSDAVAIIDAEGNVVTVNPSFARVTGWSPEAVLRRSFAELVDQGDLAFRSRLGSGGSLPWRGEFWLLRAGGAPFCAMGSLDPVVASSGKIECRVLMFFDNSENQRARDEMHHLAHYDTLTGLPNRLLFDEALRKTLAEAKANGGLFGLLFVDLDHFKAVNDTFGHALGDLLLREVGRRLRAGVREDDLVSRRSGDEFLVLLRELRGPEEARAIASRVKDAMEPVFDLEGRSTSVRCSVGIAVYPIDGKDPRNLLRHADLAMYQAKGAGRDQGHGLPESHPVGFGIAPADR